MASPGTPDLVFPRLRKVINVHGCFWHLHWCQRRRRAPVRHGDYWAAKRRGNVERDRRVAGRLRRLGWGVLVVWECETRDLGRLAGRVGRFLGEG